MTILHRTRKLLTAGLLAVLLVLSVVLLLGRKSSGGIPLVLHNVGGGTQEEDCLFSYEITGHHRLPRHGH